MFFCNKHTLTICSWEVLGIYLIDEFYLFNMIVKERIQKADGSIRFRNYLRQERLGKGIHWCYVGGFAECFTVERMEDKKLFALKIINKKNL
jgi:hypothetical protein